MFSLFTSISAPSLFPSFPHFLLPYGPPVAEASWRVCVAGLECSDEHPSPIQQHPPAGLQHFQRAQLNWQKRLSVGTAQSLRLWFPHGQGGDAHLACADRSTSFHAMVVPVGLPWYSEVALPQDDLSEVEPEEQMQFKPNTSIQIGSHSRSSARTCVKCSLGVLAE